MSSEVIAVFARIGHFEEVFKPGKYMTHPADGVDRTVEKIDVTDDGAMALVRFTDGSTTAIPYPIVHRGPEREAEDRPTPERPADRATTDAAADRTSANMPAEFDTLTGQAPEQEKPHGNRRKRRR